MRLPRRTDNRAIVSREFNVDEIFVVASALLLQRSELQSDTLLLEHQRTWLTNKNDDIDEVNEDVLVKECIDKVVIVRVKTIGR